MSIFIGIDFGGMSAKAGLFIDNVFIGKQVVATSKENAYEVTAQDMADAARQLCQKHGVAFEDVKAIGIGSPGVIDAETGNVVVWGNIDNYQWQDVPLGKLVSKYAEKPVYVTNDANAAALGEAKYGSGKNFNSSVFITLGTGVGGGIVIDGKLFEGFKSAGAEIGHMVIEVDGAACGCGRHGCFEAYASATALKRMTRRAMEENMDSLLWEVSPTLEAVDGRTAFIARGMGDLIAAHVIDVYIEYLAEGIANIVNVLRPEAILVGGGISNEGENLLIPLRKSVEEKLYVSSNLVPLKILKAELGNDAGMYGAAIYAEARLNAQK